MTDQGIILLQKAALFVPCPKCKAEKLCKCNTYTGFPHDDRYALLTKLILAGTDTHSLAEAAEVILLRSLKVECEACNKKPLQKCSDTDPVGEGCPRVLAEICKAIERVEDLAESAK